MEYFRQIPSLDQRASLPAGYVLTAYALYAVTVFMPGKSARLFITFPLLLLLAAACPFYTTGNASSDYGNAYILLSLVLFYLDFLLLCPLQGESMRFVGPQRGAKSITGVGEDDCATVQDKLVWTARLVTISRGIGWNVQVKGVPAHAFAKSTRSDFVRKMVFRAGRSWVYKLLFMAGMGFATTMKEDAKSSTTRWAMGIAIGWCGAAHSYTGIKWLYSSGAAASVAIGLCEPWEWPPMFGSLRDAWSVRQMWSTVWHQLLRRLVQKPGVRLAHLLGFKTGTIGSKYVQLYVAFAISMLMHEWQIFNAVRRDVGEFRFFAAQPFVITLEDFAGWCWRKYGPPPGGKKSEYASRIVGYIWTFAWFSYCLPPFAKGLLSVGVFGVGLLDPWALSIGQRSAVWWLQNA